MKKEEPHRGTALGPLGKITVLGDFSNGPEPRAARWTIPGIYSIVQAEDPIQILSTEFNNCKTNNETK